MNCKKVVFGNWATPCNTTLRHCCELNEVSMDWRLTLNVLLNTYYVLIIKQNWIRKYQGTKITIPQNKKIKLLLQSQTSLNQLMSDNTYLVMLH